MRAVLVGDPQGVAEAPGDDQQRALPGAFEEGVGGDGGPHADRVDGVAGPAQQRADGDHGRVGAGRTRAVRVGVVGEHLAGEQPAVGAARDDVGEGAASVDPELPACHVTTPLPRRSQRPEAVDHVAQNTLVRQLRRGTGRFTWTNSASTRSPTRTRTTPTGRSSPAASSATVWGCRGTARRRRRAPGTGRVLLRVVRVRLRDDHGDQVEAVLGRTGGAAPRHGVRTDDRSGLVVEPVATTLTVIAHVGPLPTRGQIGARRGAQVHADALHQEGHLVGHLADVGVGVREDREAAAVPGGGDEQERLVELDDGLADLTGLEVAADALGEAVEAGGDGGQVLAVLPGEVLGGPVGRPSPESTIALRMLATRSTRSSRSQFSSPLSFVWPVALGSVIDRPPLSFVVVLCRCRRRRPRRSPPGRAASRAGARPCGCALRPRPVRRGGPGRSSGSRPRV